MPNITVTNSVTPTVADLGTILTYTVVFNNVGTNTANGTLLTCSAPNGTEFVNNSLIIDGVNKPNESPILGYNLGNINAGVTVTIEFKMQVVSVTGINSINNVCNFYYYYGKTMLVISTNEAITQVKNATIVSTATVSESEAIVGTALTYDITLKNEGSENATNVNFKYNLSDNVSFNANSLIIDGIPNNTANPVTGINLGIIVPNQTITISFQATIEYLPTINPMPSRTESTYEYIGVTPQNVTSYSEYIYTKINYPYILAIETTNTEVITSNETVIYSVNILNGGNITAQNVNFKAIVGTGSIFKVGSVVINGTVNASYDIATGFNLGNIDAQSTVIVNYAVDINPTNIIFATSQSTVTATFSPISSQPPQSYEFKSNLITTKIDYISVAYQILLYGNIVATNGSNSYAWFINGYPGFTFLNVIFKDIVPREITIDSAVIRNQAIPPPIAEKLAAGINIGQIISSGGGIAIINFKLTREPPLSLYNIYNISVFEGQAQSTTGTIDFIGSSNIISFEVPKYRLTLNKILNINEVMLNGIVKCFILVTNTGNFVANSVKVVNLLPSNLSFIPNSLIINSTSNSPGDPNTGIQLGTINIGEMVGITFNAQLITPTLNLLNSFATATGEFFLSPSTTPINSTFYSNITQLKLVDTKVNVIKSVDKVFAQLDDIIKYTITIYNQGNINIDNVNFKDIVPTNLTFVENSVTINSVDKPGFNPSLGFNIGTIVAQGSSNVVFYGKITTTPTSLIKNSATIEYTYTVNKINYPGSEESNIVATGVVVPEMTAIKTSDKSYVALNDIITYTVDIYNGGNIDAENVYFQDIISKEFTFELGSVLINGVKDETLNPNVGFNLRTIVAGATYKVSFKVKVTSQIDKVVKNKATINYDIIVNSSQPPINQTIETNVVDISSIMSIWITVNTEYASLNDIITYTIKIRDNLSIEIRNFICEIELTPNLEFIEGSLIIDTNSKYIMNKTLIEENSYVNKKREISSILQRKGNVVTVPISSIKPNGIVTITFQVKVINLIGNIAIGKVTAIYKGNSFFANTSVLLRSGNITLTEYVDKELVSLNEEFSYTIIMKNKGNEDCTDLIFKSEIQCNTVFIPESFTIDTINVVNADPTRGVNMKDLAPGEGRTITFKVKAVSPKPLIIQNQSLASYKFIKNPSEPPISETVYSNMVFCTIEGHQLTVTKMSNKTIANPGDTITFTVTISNNRNETAMNLKFIDILAENLEFIPKSFQVNGKSVSGANIKTGVSIENIESLGYTTISFKVKVKYSIRPPRICNVAYVNVYYLELNKELQFISNVCRVIIGPVKFYKFGSATIHYLP